MLPNKHRPLQETLRFYTQHGVSSGEHVVVHLILAVLYLRCLSAWDDSSIAAGLMLDSMFPCSPLTPCSPGPPWHPSSSPFTPCSPGPPWHPCSPFTPCSRFPCSLVPVSRPAAPRPQPRPVTQFAQPLSWVNGEHSIADSCLIPCSDCPVQLSGNLE